MRSTSIFVFLIASFVAVVLPVSGQETVSELVDILEKRDQLLFDQPEFSLSFRMAENEVFLPESIGAAQIALEIKANKMASDWAVSRQFSNDIFPVSNKPHYLIFKNKELFEWRSEAISVGVSRMNENTNIANMLSYLRFAGFTPSKAIAEDAGTNWNTVKLKTMKYFMVTPLAALLSEQHSTFSVEKNASQNIVLKNKTEEIELDPQKGFVVVRRTMMHEDGVPIREIIASGFFRELVPGVWMPERIDVKRFAGGNEMEPREIWGKLAAIAHWELGEFSLTADKSAFDVEVPPGIMISDGIRGIVYRTSLDSDPFGPSISESQIVKDLRSGVSYWLLASLTFVLGIALFFVWTKWRKR